METQPGADRGISYGGLLRDSFYIFWRNKFLWVLALLPALVSGLSSFLGSLGGLVQPDASGQVPSALLDNLVTVVVVGIVVVLVVLVVAIFVSVVTAGAMTSAVSEIDRGHGSSFGAAWRAGMSCFWRVFVQGILKALISFALVLVPVIVCGIPVLLTFLLSQSTGLRVAMAVIFGLLFLLLLILLSIPTAVVFQYALRGLVIDGEGAAASISSGYRVFRRNFGKSLLVWLIAVVFGIIFAIVSGTIGFVISIAITGASLGFTQTVTPSASVVAQLVALVPTTIISVLTIAFLSSYWTIAYRRVTDRHAGVREATTGTS